MWTTLLYSVWMSNVMWCLSSVIRTLTNSLSSILWGTFGSKNFLWLKFTSSGLASVGKSDSFEGRCRRRDLSGIRSLQDEKTAWRCNKVYDSADFSSWKMQKPPGLVCKRWWWASKRTNWLFSYWLLASDIDPQPGDSKNMRDREVRKSRWRLGEGQ